MSQPTLRRVATPDANHAIHIQLPPEITGPVQVFILPADPAMSEESLLAARLMDESGFAQQVLNAPEEDCWNEL